MVFIFKDIVLLSYEEIAQIQEKDETAIRQMVSRTRKKLKRFLNNECALYNPRGPCHCRMKKWVKEINLPGEYEKLRSIARSINLYRESQTVLPGKNYWEKYL
jgi:RNA polymerase sigma-70 factor (ECF subfamily)